MKQWVTPKNVLAFRRGSKKEGRKSSIRNSVTWMPSKKLSTFSPSISERKKATSGDHANFGYYQRNENFQVVERTIGIDSCPHKYGSNRCD
jgi:hypothetical protein